MKNTTQMALIAAAALATALPAQAQATYNGDLVIGLTKGSGNDLMYDLGSASSLTSGHTWSLGSLFTVDASTHWGVIGNTLNGTGLNTDNQIYTSTSDSSTLPAGISTSGYKSVNAAMGGMYNLLPAAGSGQFVQVAFNSGSGNSWNEQTVSPTLTTQYKNAYEDPNVIRIGSDALWSVDDKTTLAKTLLGTFALDGSGTLTFTATAVPEPSTYGLFAGLGVLALSLRRQLRRSV
jgi:hypothetical protein